MKNITLTIIIILLCGCSSQPEQLPSVKFTFSGTNLSIVTPDGWARSKIPSSKYLTVFGEINFGIHPNIQLEKYQNEDLNNSVVKEYIEQKKTMYPNYGIIKEESFTTISGLTGQKIKAKRINKDKIPIIHLSYIFNINMKTTIMSATCAEPTLQLVEGIFDNTMKSIQFE